MPVKLVKHKGFCGEKASIYVVIDKDSNTNPFQTFVNQWDGEYHEKMLNFIGRLSSIGKITGAIEDFFKLNENEKRGEGENVCALYDEPDKEMRLYCVRISEKILVLGGGGPKPSNIHRWQECPILSEAARYMILISEAIKTNLRHNTLQFSEDELTFSGDLTIIK